MHACPCSIMICRAQAQHYSRVQLATATSDRDATPLASELPAAMPMPMPTGSKQHSPPQGEGGTQYATRRAPLPSPVPLLSAPGASQCFHGLDHGSLPALASPDRNMSPPLRLPWPAATHHLVRCTIRPSIHPSVRPVPCSVVRARPGPG